jgi:hypothetical protein
MPNPTPDEQPTDETETERPAIVVSDQYLADQARRDANMVQDAYEGFEW